MPKENLTIKASKYHYDLKYKYKNYSKDSWLLSRRGKKIETLFVPKSIVSIFEGMNGNCEFSIPAWWANQNESRKEFFQI